MPEVYFMSQQREEQNQQGENKHRKGLEKENTDLKEKKEGIQRPNALQWSVRLLRWLDPVFFWASIAFLGWLLVDFVLGLLTAFWAGLALRVVQVPIMASLAPLATGYWAVWITLHLLFHPIKKNLLWQGVLPARGGDLVGAVAVALKEHLLSQGSLHRYIKEQNILPELLPRLTQATDDASGEKEFREALRSVLSEWIKSTLERDDARRVVRDAVGNVIGAWRAQHLWDKPMEWTKNVWRSWVEEKVIQAFPAIPDAMVGATDELKPWIQQLAKTLGQEGEPIDEALAQGLSLGFQALDMDTLVHERLNEQDRARAVRAVEDGVRLELKSLQALGGLIGIAMEWSARIAILRGVFLGFAGLIWIIYRFTAKKHA